jgi:hypothetical protein
MQCEELEVVLEQEGWTPLPEAARAHVATCHSCKNLVDDLTAVVATAHMLPAEIEPPPRVWLSLRAGLEAQGIIKTHIVPHRAPWIHGLSELFRARILATAAVAALIVAAIILQVQSPATRPTEALNANSYDDTAAALNTDEAHLPPMQLAPGSVVDVSLRKNLDIVDNFIADCEQRVKEQPQDDFAREYLSGAYRQKAELLAALMERSGSGLR